MCMTRHAQNVCCFLATGFVCCPTVVQPHCDDVRCALRLGYLPWLGLTLARKPVLYGMLTRVISQTIIVGAPPLNLGRADGLGKVIGRCLAGGAAAIRGRARPLLVWTATRPCRKTGTCHESCSSRVLGRICGGICGDPGLASLGPNLAS